MLNIFGEKPPMNTVVQSSKSMKGKQCLSAVTFCDSEPVIRFQMIFPALVFLGLKNNDCCGCCGNESCGKRFAMFTSTIFAVIGFLGAGYSFVISAISINRGPKCLMDNSTWGYPFHDGDYLNDEALWSKCLKPEDVVPWNLTLFSILLVVGAIQMLLCVIQVVNGLLGTLCGDCQCCGCCGGDGPV
uniref:Transmembrane 4 L six family member 4 n=2 Tax=Canis lupus familiaris TaxID=9615 RepID=A0A8P0SQX0_CANLF